MAGRRRSARCGPGGPFGVNRPTATGRQWVAIILAVGIATAINLITFAVLYDAIFSAGPGLSENATQILTTAFGGIIGVLGAYLGFRAGRAESEDEERARRERENGG